MAWTVPPSFVEIGPKLRLGIPLTWEWPKRAKNRGEPQKMTPNSETEFFWGWSEWESCSPRHAGDRSGWQKLQLPYKKFIFFPKFFGQKNTLSSLASGQCFQHRKSVSLVPWYEKTKGFTPSPKKMDFWPKNGKIWPKTGIFDQLLATAVLAHWHCKPFARSAF